jgi:Coenzyme PQQ synthesis protein D (PqqD)
VARTAGLTSEQVDGELVIYNEQREPVLRLNRPAALVWLNSDGRHTVTDLVAVLAEELGELADEDQVMIALDELDKHDLIESGYKQRAPSEVRISRRGFVRRAGAVAAAAVGIPVVYSLVAPGVASGSATHHYHYVYRPRRHRHHHRRHHDDD